MKVVQTWDDGIVSDIRLIEILQKYKAKATFCLTPGLYSDNRSFGWIYKGREVWRLAMKELAEVYAGFEICSHSMTHPCLTEIPSDRLFWELRTSKIMLENLFQKPVTGFCYPFNAYNDVVKDAVGQCGYLWARGGEHREDGYPPDDPLAFCPSCHFRDQNFREKFERANQAGGVFFFWGHSYELTDALAWNAFESVIQSLSLTPGVEWAFVSELFEPAL